MLHATIMAGGSGTRFWPASRRNFPKQLLALSGKQTMLQSAVSRLEGLCAPEQTLILTNRRLVDATRQQIPRLPPDSVIGEPCKRDTAPCIALAATLISQRDPEAVMLVMPADHVIEQVQSFQNAVRKGLALLNEDPTRIITFGIEPSYAADVYGYIHRGEANGPDSYKVARFCEKPDRTTAEGFLRQGGFYWNAGIFLWKARTILEALDEFEPQIIKHIRTIGQAVGKTDFEEILATEFEAIVGKSIDYAVLEHYDNVCVLSAEFDWDDVGNWTAVERLGKPDEQGNTVSGRHLSVRTSNSIIRGGDDHLVVTLGLDDCIVVHTPDATLVAHKNDEAAVKEIVRQIEELGWEEYL